jgi:hypothetical protein
VRYHARGIADNDSARRHIPNRDGSGSHYCTRANRDTRANERLSSNPGSRANFYRRCS